MSIHPFLFEEVYVNIYTLSASISDYFSFGKTYSEKLFVSSICADNVSGECEKKEFGCLVSDKIKDLLKADLLNSHNAYVIFNKVFYNSPTRVDKYKKIWKNDSVKPYVNLLEIKDEIMTKYENFYLISGVAFLKTLNEINLFSILDMYGFSNLLFFSKKKLDDIYIELKNIQNTIFLGSLKSPKINYDELLKVYCKNGNILIRYGTTFTDMEVAIIYNLNDFPNTFQFIV